MNKRVTPKGHPLFCDMERHRGGCEAARNHSNKRSPDNPPAAGNPGNKPGRDGTADECAYRYGRNGGPDRNQRVGDITVDEETGYWGEVEKMHQVHSEREFGEAGHHCRSLFPLNAGEHQEGAERGKKHIRSAELPGPLQHRRLDKLTRDSLQPERPACECGTCKETQDANTKSLRLVPAQVKPDIMRHHQISQIA